jgi:hypothetical protein
MVNEVLAKIVVAIFAYLISNFVALIILNKKDKFAKGHEKGTGGKE